MRLTVELVPQTAFGKNVRSDVSKAVWDRIRKKCYALAEYKCDICGGKGKRHPVECHEVWEYDDDTHTQYLRGFVALCPLCHRVKHLGRTMAVGFGNSALQHLCKVNYWSMEKTRDYVEEVFTTWQQRSMYPWTLDISFVDQYIKEN